MGLAPVIAACGVEGEESEVSLLADDALPPPLTLSQPGSLHTGQTITFLSGGATPGARVYLAGGVATGPGPCPPVLQGTCLDIPSPMLLGSSLASLAGQVSFDVILPHAMADGRTLYFQTVQAAGKSPVLSDVTTHPRRACADVPWLDDTTYYQYPEVIACGPIPASGVCPLASSLGYAEEAWLFEYNVGVPPLWTGYEIDVVCDETTVHDACCFHSYVVPGPIIGRPFEVGGVERLADVGVEGSWSAPLDVDVSALSRSARRRLGWAWTQQARGEHASVAAFSRFVLQLMQLGAPAELVAEATRAMGDEIRHARTAFAVASAMAGEPVGAGALDTAGSLDAMDVVSMVRGAIREGCVGETIAAAQALAAHDGCTVPELKAHLLEIADDETRHAALAWRFVRWILATRPELRDVVRDELAQAPRLAPVGPEPHAELLRTWGQLPAADMNDVARQVVASVVRPCAERMLGDEPAIAAA